MKKFGALILALLGVITLLAACSGGSGPQAAVKSVFESAVKNDWAAVSASVKDEEKALSAMFGAKAAFPPVAGGLEPVVLPMKEVCEKLKGTVLSSEKKGAGATVQAEVTAVDMTKLYQLYQDKAASLVLDTVKKDTEKQKELTGYLRELITGQQAPVKTGKLTLTLQKEDGAWKLIANPAFLDAISGGYYSAFLK